MVNIRFTFFWLIILLLFSHCTKQINSPPSAIVNITPHIGDSTTVFLLDASNSYDEESPTWSLKSRWDFNNDGEWDTEFSTNHKTSHRFIKTGQYKLILQIIDQDNQTDLDSISITITNYLRDSVMIDNRNQRSYPIVKIHNRWWMAEDLIVGNPKTYPDEPLDNGIPEYYWTDGQISPGTAYFSWDETTDYGRDTIKGICPEGWRIPNIEDIEGLIRFDRGYFALDDSLFFRPGGYYGLNIPLNGFFVGFNNQIRRFGEYSCYWIGERESDTSYNLWFHEQNYMLQIANSSSNKRYFSWFYNEYSTTDFHNCYLTVRCLKDE